MGSASAFGSKATVLALLAPIGPLAGTHGAPEAAVAQAAPAGEAVIAPGHRIKVVLTTSRTMIRFASGLDSSQIWFRSGPSSAEISVPFEQLRQLFVQFGDHPAVSRGASIGAKVGPVIGLAAALTHFFNRDEFAERTTSKAVGYGAIGIAAGAGIGALAGGLIGLAYRQPSWAPVDPRRLRLVTTQGVGAGFSFSY